MSALHYPNITFGLPQVQRLGQVRRLDRFTPGQIGNTVLCIVRASFKIR